MAISMMTVRAVVGATSKAAVDVEDEAKAQIQGAVAAVEVEAVATVVLLRDINLSTTILVLTADTKTVLAVEAEPLL